MPRSRLTLPDSAYLDRSATDGRMHAPSAERNFAPILAALTPHVPSSGVALEIASGTGQHIAALARAFAHLTWLPSDIEADRIASINAWRASAAVENLLAPIHLDAAEPWIGVPDDLALIYVVNLFHLIPDVAARAVIANIARGLGAGGHVFIYGPFRDGDTYRSDGDATFDASLRAQDARIGYKSDIWMANELAGVGLQMLAPQSMPANNLALVAQKP